MARGRIAPALRRLTRRASATAAVVDGEATTKITKVVHTKLRGLQVIQNPMLNRGTGFSVAERERLGLRGLVPPRRQGLEHQMARVMSQLEQCATPLDKHQYLSNLMDRNTTLFYRVLLDNFADLAPIIYTPTVCMHAL